MPWWPGSPRPSRRSFGDDPLFPLIPDPLLPLALVAACALLYPARREPGPVVTALLLAAVAWAVGRYFWWRVTETLLPPGDITVAVIGMWIVFAIELAAWFDAGVLLAQLARRTDRSGEADRHEARLRDMPASDLPHVDVLITTFNEPLDVLERTIIGAMALTWPADRIHVYVLDDGRRDWLALYCTEKGIGYLTRDDNSHAKAGNINEALKRTGSEFFLILDADFIPQRNMLFRMMGFFDDPRVGIVQAPHEFFNFDPLQSNLGMRNALPSDQKFFFREIMRGRDGWDCAFCCGSNSITRRSAIDEIGGAMPTGSITEDMLLTLALLRKGYTTRYLCERLAVGLAPESLEAFFTQRARWARGALQMLYLREGPLGPGLSLLQRIMFLPTHWLTQSLMQVTMLMLPVIYLLFGFAPMFIDDVGDILAFQIPAIAATILVLRRLAPDAYYPIPATILGALQSFRFLPMLVRTLFRPHGHRFVVTPKGSAAHHAMHDRFTVRLSLFLIWGMTAGFLAAIFGGQSGDGAKVLFPVVAFWSVINGTILAAMLMIAFARPVHRAEERFFLETEVAIFRANGPSDLARSHDVSLSGAQLTTRRLTAGEWIAVQIAGVPPIPAQVAWSGGGMAGVRFWHVDEEARELLIETIFTDCDQTLPTEHRPQNLLFGLLVALFSWPRKTQISAPEALGAPPPEIFAWYDTLRTGTSVPEHWPDGLSDDPTMPLSRLRPPA